MSNTDKSKPAFPVTEANGANSGECGMTLRQYAAIKLKVPDSRTDWLGDMIEKSLRTDFAAKAMQGIVCAPHSTDDDKTAAVYLSDGLGFSDGMRGRVAVAAYAMADEILRAREA